MTGCGFTAGRAHATVLLTALLFLSSFLLPQLSAVFYDRLLMGSIRGGGSPIAIFIGKNGGRGGQGVHVPVGGHA